MLLKKKLYKGEEKNVINLWFISWQVFYYYEQHAGGHIYVHMDLPLSSFLGKSCYCCGDMICFAHKGSATFSWWSQVKWNSFSFAGVGFGTRAPCHSTGHKYFWVEFLVGDEISRLSLLVFFLALLWCCKDMILDTYVYVGKKNLLSSCRIVCICLVCMYTPKERCWTNWIV